MTLHRFLPPEGPPARVIAHVDMDAFYASVEERENPALKGLPVVVGADPKGGRGRGVVTTASYAARKFGVRSAMPVSHAYRLCPHAVWLRPDFTKYGDASRRVFSVFRRFAPVVEAASIDEAYLDLSSAVADFDAARALARRIQDAVQDEERLSCSIGLASSRTVAKIASDRDKPAGLTVVPPGTEAAFLAPLPARVIPGVGPKTGDALAAAGIVTCADLAQADAEWLADRFGSWGPRLGQLARGVDHAPVVPEWDRKSVGAESTFPEDASDPDALRETVDALAAECAEGLVANGSGARTITLKVRLSDFTTFTRARTLPDATADAARIADVAHDLLAANWPPQPVRLLGVRATGLTRRPARQSGLTEWPEGEAPREWAPRGQRRLHDVSDAFEDDVAAAWQPPAPPRRWF